MNETEAAGMAGAGESSGLVTRKDARKFLTRRQLARRIGDRVLVAVCPRVYRVIGAPETWMQSLVAIQLWAKDLVFSHRTAAALHGLEGFEEGPVELTSTRRLRIPQGATVYRVEALRRCERTEVNDLPVTKIPRTLVDLMAMTDWYTMKTAVDQVLRDKEATLDELQAAAERAKGRPGVARFRELLAAFTGDDGPTESELENLCLDVISDAGLPKPTVQWRVVAGRKRRRLDLIFKGSGVVIEADGYASHSSVEVFEDDRERNNSLVAGGLRVLHWTWHGVNERPDELIAELYAVLNHHH